MSRTPEQQAALNRAMNPTLPPDRQSGASAGDMVTAEQLAATNARLDAFDAGQRRAANRARAQDFTPHLPAAVNYVSRTLHHEMIHGGIGEEALADPTVSRLLEGVRGLAKDVGEDCAWLTDAGAAFRSMTGSLLKDNSVLLASAFAGEADKFGKKVSRVIKRLELLDGQSAQLEREEKAHAQAARNSLSTSMPAHVASEIRQWLRAMPSDSARSAAVSSSIAAGDRELMHAISEKGVPAQILGFSDRKMFDQLITYAERTFGAEHVRRREATVRLRERVTELRAHLQRSSDEVCGFAMLERHPHLAKLVQQARQA